jgi:hypothetical protein
VRVSLGQFHKALSPLSGEVLPDEIPDPVEVIGPDHPDYVYNYDYVASTDPVHPVDTNYAQPFDEVDPAWMLNRLSPEEFEQSGEGIGFDANEADMLWGNGPEGVNAELADWVKDTPGWTAEAAGFVPSLAPGDAPRTAAVERQIEVCAEDDDFILERVDMVIQCYWKVINGNTASDQVSQTAMSNLSENLDDFQGLHIPCLQGGEGAPQTGLLIPPPTPPRLSTDGSCGFEFSTSIMPRPSRN